MSRSTKASLPLKDDRTWLFLDDLRFVDQAFEHTHNTIYLHHNWYIVRNHDEFVEFITLNGLPSVISFDHDLGEDQYTPEEYWVSYEASKAWQESQVYKEKTGFDCAKWLVEYCMDKCLPLPDFYCHSQNPVGKDNILGLLNNYKEHEINSNSN